jgi:hypothetical protein
MMGDYGRYTNDEKWEGYIEANSNKRFTYASWIAKQYLSSISLTINPVLIGITASTCNSKSERDSFLLFTHDTCPKARGKW